MIFQDGFNPMGEEQGSDEEQGSEEEQQTDEGGSDEGEE
jgi:hypothetical protein